MPSVAALFIPERGKDGLRPFRVRRLSCLPVSPAYSAYHVTSNMLHFSWLNATQVVAG